MLQKQIAPKSQELNTARLVSHSRYVSNSSVANSETAILITQQSSFHDYQGKANHKCPHQTK